MRQRACWLNSLPHCKLRLQAGILTEAEKYTQINPQPMLDWNRYMGVGGRIDQLLDHMINTEDHGVV